MALLGGSLLTLSAPVASADDPLDAVGDPRWVSADDPLSESVIDPLSVSVNDPLRRLQWHLDRTGVPAAWALSRGSPEVTIAVIDTGVDDRHGDLAGAFWRDPRSGSYGFNHVDGSFETFVSQAADWHGTAVAGVAAARADDGFGIAGVAPGARLMVHRIYASTAVNVPPTQTSYANAVQAIQDAKAAGADVLLLTWGGTTPSSELLAAIRGSGLPVVASAGNDGQDLSGAPSIRRYPAMYQLPNLVTVAASDRNDRILSNERIASNYGASHVELAAPGEDIVSLSGSGHALFEGTSFAAPQVAAALALGRSIAPNATANGLVGALLRTVRRVPALTDKVTTGGVLDVAAFLRSVDRPACGTDLPPTAFVDVSRSSPHAGNIDCVVWYGVAVGTSADRFSPRRTITRGEMATFIARTLEAGGYDVGSVPSAGFTDTAGTTHERSIDIVAAAGIAKGTGGGRFEPGRHVTRGQMATFVVGAVETLVGTELTSSQRWFDDVAGTTHERSILVARELEISLGTSDPRTFEPNREMPREQMASFVARTLDALGRRGVTVERRS
jgi:subtilisin family serine protease